MKYRPYRDFRRGDYRGEEAIFLQPYFKAGALEQLSAGGQLCASVGE
ncbi:MAG: hypothetical protein LBK60_08935 [Verrucomicrobiales bacterium]|nr:hypothetical protein [Verrucomicrobiales bacterium]